MSEPTPGSVEARKLGCTCAVLDNNHGRFPPYPPDGWWITAGCPVHAGKAAADKVTRICLDAGIDD